MEYSSSVNLQTAQQSVGNGNVVNIEGTPSFLLEILGNFPGLTFWVVYLVPADNISEPLPSRLRGVNQPVMRSAREVSGPRAARLASWWTHLPHVISRSSGSDPASQRFWLRPRRHAEHEHFTQAPHPIRQPGRHRWRLEAPLPGRARALGGLRLCQRQT
jgi:hypothetical protein